MVDDGLVGAGEGCDCVIVDDMIDTAGTLTAAANELRAFGARRVFAFATHGLFSGPAADRIEQCVLEECVVANTVPLAAAVREKTRKSKRTDDSHGGGFIHFDEQEPERPPSFFEKTLPPVLALLL